MSKIKNFFNKIFSLFGFNIIKKSSMGKLNLEILKEPIIEEEFKKLIKKIEKIYNKKYSPHSLYSVYTSCKYIYENKIEGDIIECGVYEGVCIAMVLLYFSEKNDFSRSIYLYDTFEGMTKPSENDYYFINDKKLYEGDNFCSLDDVKNNLSSIYYDKSKINYIKGDVAQTLQKNNHQSIALLRLDTDFYESTLNELNSLYKSVISGGFIIYDDYGHWRGQHEAVNYFHQKNNIRPLLIRTSRKERIEIK